MTALASALGRTLNYVAAAGLLVIFLRRAEWRVVADGFHRVTWSLIALAVLVRLASIAVSALRWQALLAPLRHVPYTASLMATLIGSAASAVLPIQVAEFVRPILLSRRYRLRATVTAATAIVEWALDAVAVFTLFALALLWLGLPDELFGVVRGAPLVLAFAVAVMGGLFLLGRRSGEGRLPSAIARSIDGFAAGLRVLTDRRQALRLCTQSFVIAALTAISAWLTLAAFEMRVSVGSGFVLLGLVTLAGMIPTPGAVGGFEVVCQVGLAALFHFDRVRTIGPVLGLHAVTYAPAAFAGAICLAAWPLRQEQAPQ
ncbi:MAG TPA: lysylphosphatidylglycerol synthase transmembrane domain-containing protein [Vicinamibacterales bacterium]|jgi:uncharacterized protein (TIRG00374 family)